MAKRTNSIIDFAVDRNILTFRPNIHYVEPESVDEVAPVVKEPITTLDTLKTEAQDLTQAYKDIEQACDDIQLQINNRAANVKILLDPVQDGHVIAAIQRHFGDPAKTDITYDDYLSCIEEISAAGEENLSLVDSKDVQESASDIYRDKFGALGYPSGLARPELQSQNISIEPIDLNEFKSDQIESLINILKPTILKLAKEAASGGLL